MIEFIKISAEQMMEVSSSGFDTSNYYEKSPQQDDLDIALLRATGFIRPSIVSRIKIKRILC